MTTKFSFWAYGILAVAAFAMFLYTTTSLAGRADVGGPLLNVAILIVVTFIIYMFAKLIARKF
jgi:hypothetical protein